VSVNIDFKQEMDRKIDELGPKLNDCPALVLPCTTARYTTTRIFIRTDFFSFSVMGMSYGN
jgi:hypothetical protein